MMDQSSFLRISNHSVRFGEFVHVSEQIIFEVIFEMEKASPYDAAIGFMTPEFDEQMEPFGNYNTGNNHSCCVSGDGYFVNSDDFIADEYENKDYIEGFEENLWEEGDKLHVEIDMIEQKG